MKKILISLLVGFVGFVGFGYCDTVWNSADNIVGLGNNGTYNLTAGSCIKPYAGNGCERGFNIYDTSDNLVYRAWNNLSNGFEGFICVDFDGYLKNENGLNCNYSFYLSDGCIVDTGSILSGSCDINYCVENGLCPTSSGSRSELKINDIVHEGKPLINISIPDNIWWDFASNENQFDLYVGSGYDQDYIDNILKINSYRPDNEDFTQIFVSGLTLIFPYIFVALLIVFMWKLLKRIFK